MTTNRGLLLVMMEPPASLEEEFNDWYDTEHFPQRSAVPGFESASRWVCLDGWPRWLAIYDLATLDVLLCDAYREMSGAKSMPWSRRILPRTVGRSRIAALGLTGNAPLQASPLSTARLLLVGIPAASQQRAEAMASHVRDALRDCPHLIQLRGFFMPDGDVPTAWLIASFDAPVQSAEIAQAIGRPGGSGPTTFNLYAPYRRGG